jgi:hypothetical protein
MLASTCGNGVWVNPVTLIRREAASGPIEKAGNLSRYPSLPSTQAYYVPEGFAIQPDP